jgi:hypothetical protein
MYMLCGFNYCLHFTGGKVEAKSSRRLAWCQIAGNLDARIGQGHPVLEIILATLLGFLNKSQHYPACVTPG